MNTNLVGSLTNRMLERANTPTPEVGMGATELCYSDRHAYTIIAIHNGGKKAWVKADTAKITSGSAQNGSAKYEYTPNDNSPVELITLRRDGRWHLGTSVKDPVMAIGYREEYYDPTF